MKSHLILGLWYAVATFALGFAGSYLVLTKTLGWLPAWVTLGGSAVVAVWIGVYYVVVTASENRRYEAERARGLRAAERRYFS